MKRDSPDDAALVVAMLRGEESGFHAFFDTYFSRVYRFAFPRVGRDAELAKEIVQATLVKAVRNIAGYRAEAALFSWLCQICRREIVDQQRARSRRAQTIVLIDDSPVTRAAVETVEAPADDEPAHGYGTAETRALVQTVMDRLPGRYGDVLEWKYIEGRSVEEIGVLLGISQTAAQSILARARTAFRVALEAEFGSTARDLLASLRQQD